MKKQNYSAAFVAVLIGLGLWSQAAQAQEFKPYVGVDLMRTSVSYGHYDDGVVAFDWEDGLADGLNGVNIHVGNRFHKNFGAELGYFRTKEESKSFDILGAPASSKIKLSGFTLDGLGYLPVDDKGRFELIGTAGVSYIKGEIEATAAAAGFTGSEDESEFGFRAGGGAQVNLTDSMNLRGLVRYQTADFEDVADRAWIYSAGLNYTF